MIVCVCRRVTEREIRVAVRTGGASCLDSLGVELGVATQCGRCGDCARRIVCEEMGRTAASPTAGDERRASFAAAAATA